MKRLIVLIIAATVCGLAASAQEVSSDSKGGVEVSAVARFDVNPYFPLKRGIGTDFSFSNTSIYSFVEGEFGSGWSYYISNHWLGVDWYKSSEDGDSLSPLYSNSWHSDANNWLDFATLSYSLETESVGTWDFTIGKDCMALALTELDAYDVDTHFDLTTLYCNETALYQWGASVGWTSASENSNIIFQINSSPLSIRPYQDFRKAFVLKWTQKQGWWNGAVSLNAIEGYAEGYEYVHQGAKTPSLWWKGIALAETFTFGDLNICIDAMLRGYEWKNLANESLVSAKLQYDFGEKASLFAKAGFEVWGYEPKGVKPEKYVFAGIGTHYYPLRDSQALRLHAVISASNNLFYSPYQLSVNFGITYNFCISDLWNK